MPLVADSRDLGVDSLYERLNKFAADLFPGRYTRAYVQQLAGMAQEVRALAAAKKSLIVAHNYQYPELQEVAETVGDSLKLSQYVAAQKASRVDFCGVQFMAETAKIILGDSARVYMPDLPGCSLVASIDPRRLDHWMAANPGGIVISYVNTDAATKARSDIVCTSRNAGAVVEYAVREYPGRRILFLPDKYLGAVVLAQTKVDPALVDLYDGHCHVHARIGETALEDAMDRHPEAELLIHPECGCASACMAKAMSGRLPYQKAYFLSTDQMITHAAASASREFVVATETGMLYRLRKEVAGKKFYPVSDLAVCEYMKMNTLEKLLDSLRLDRVEIVLDPAIRERARAAIERMLAIS